MVWILGVLMITCIISWMLSYYCVNTSLEIIAFMSGVVLFVVLVVWGITHIESSNDYRYLEECLQYSDSGHTISNVRFLELYTKYQRENQHWIGRQFNARPSKLLEDFFKRDYVLRMAFE